MSLPFMFIKSSVRRYLAFSLAFIFLFLIQIRPAEAEPRIGEVEVLWEDSLAIVQPEILDPFDESLERTLRSGIPVVIKVEIRFLRTGYARSEYVNVRVQYDVWNGSYRVVTPISPFSIEKLSTVKLLLKNNLVIPFPRGDLNGSRAWFVKVRAGAEIADEEGEEVSGVEDDLSGVVKFFFSLFGGGDNMGDWSELVRLPEASEDGS